MIEGLIDKEYNKRTGYVSGLFNRLLPKQPLAITNAKDIYRPISHGNPAQEESATTVFRLVEELNKYV